MRRDQIGWICIDVGNSAFATTILAAMFPVYFPSLLPKEGISFSLGPWSWTSTALSIWGYTVSLSVLLAFLMAPILGAWADRGGHKKLLLGVSALMGSSACIALGACTPWPNAWQWSLFFFVLGNIGFSGNNVFYNSLMTSVSNESEWDKMSLRGFAWGYIGGGFVLAANLLLVLKYEWFGLSSRIDGLRLSFISVGIWWLLFTLPPLLWIKEKTELHPQTLFRPFLSFWNTLKSLPKTPALLLFMLSFALYNDGISTVISMSSIFGKEVLQLTEGTLIGTLLLIQFLGLPFTLGMNRLAEKWGGKQVLMGSLIFWLVIIFYAYRMTTGFDFWILGVLVSIVLGVSQALSRSLFARLIPTGKQGEYFSFFALSGKATSVLGPTLFAVVRDKTGDARLSVLTLGVLFVLGLGVLSFVSIDPKKSPR